jgi:hypothetical protein
LNQSIKYAAFLHLNNRGYGGSGGRSTEEGNVVDAIAAHEYLIGLGVPAGRIAAYSESLGSGQAVQLAAARSVAGGCAESTANLNGRRGTKDVLFVAIGLLITDKYDNERNIRSLNRFSSCTASRIE